MAKPVTKPPPVRAREVAKEPPGRMNIRLPNAVRRVLEIAARASGETLTMFLLKSALARARVTVFDQVALEEADRALREHGLRF